MGSKNTPQPQAGCELGGKCEFAAGCYCRGIKENQCLVVSNEHNLIEVNRARKPHCAATVFYGFTTTFCRCIRRGRKNHDN